LIATVPANQVPGGVFGIAHKLCLIRFGCFYSKMCALYHEKTKFREHPHIQRNAPSDKVPPLFAPANWLAILAG